MNIIISETYLYNTSSWLQLLRPTKVAISLAVVLSSAMQLVLIYHTMIHMCLLVVTGLLAAKGIVG